jgi:hypothetical protein
VLVGVAAGAWMIGVFPASMEVEVVEKDVEKDVEVKIGVVEVDEVVIACPSPTLFCFGTTVHLFPFRDVIENVDIVT